MAIPNFDDTLKELAQIVERATSSHKLAMSEAVKENTAKLKEDHSKGIGILEEKHGAKISRLKKIHDEGVELLVNELKEKHAQEEENVRKFVKQDAAKIILEAKIKLAREGARGRR